MITEYKLIKFYIWLETEILWLKKNICSFWIWCRQQVLEKVDTSNKRQKEHVVKDCMDCWEFHDVQSKMSLKHLENPDKSLYWRDKA